MAELLKIKSEAEELRKEYFFRNNQAEENRQKENQAATRIQCWFRACKVQAYLRHLHEKAIIIQKIWRGFTARARFRQMVKAAYFIMKMNFYNEMAVRIQRRWRGFFVRKSIHNFYARKSYLERLSIKNELVRRELDELEELQKRERDCLDMIKEQTVKLYQAHRLHHLLSTKQGLFREPGEVWEQRVRCPDLTLHLQNSYTHLEETQNQLRQHKGGTGSVLHHLSHSSNSFTQLA
ncbi:spermatogenesis-associated protein 17 isoform X2 [Seriola lalandi dorsalis]|uniref:spermatogenesis-associated protein 17 isoform X2 n=1 Tax=Seriola lalandi dorsalis TaxID=1841481 RepID=UPI000C6FA7ED|nr:spermatogenesis-associated protein 17 isoform X2 [Seriola lalandi dorsalis]